VTGSANSEPGNSISASATIDHFAGATHHDLLVIVSPHEVIWDDSMDYLMQAEC
jgi:hypothetical protein